MKKLILALVMVVSMFVIYCSHTKMYILGVDVDEVVKEKDVVLMVVGAVSSLVTHIAGHYIAAELVGADIEQQVNKEIITNYDELNNSDRRWFARGGFVAQTLANTVLTSFESTRKSKFTRGFTLTTMLGIGTYPLRWPDEWGEMHYLDINGGDSGSEWTLYMGFSAYNFYRINKENIDQL